MSLSLQHTGVMCFYRIARINTGSGVAWERRHKERKNVMYWIHPAMSFPPLANVTLSLSLLTLSLAYLPSLLEAMWVKAFTAHSPCSRLKLRIQSYTYGTEGEGCGLPCICLMDILIMHMVVGIPWTSVWHSGQSVWFLKKPTLLQVSLNNPELIVIRLTYLKDNNKIGTGNSCMLP